MHPATHLPSHRIADLATHRNSSREFSRLFLRSYHVLYISNTLKPSATSQSSRQNPAFFFPSSPKAKCSHKFPISQASLMWTLPFPQTSGSKNLEQRRAGQQTPADASCTDSLVERPNSQRRPPSQQSVPPQPRFSTSPSSIPSGNQP